MLAVSYVATGAEVLTLPWPTPSQVPPRVPTRIQTVFRLPLDMRGAPSGIVLVLPTKPLEAPE